VARPYPAKDGWSLRLTCDKVRYSANNGKPRSSLALHQQVIFPSGKNLSSPVCKNIPLRVSPKSLLKLSPSRSTEGRFAVVTNAGWDAVDADSAIDERHEGGRRSRVVLTPRRWCQVGGSNSADDGGKRARSPGRARYKPLKPLRAGMPGCSGGLVVTNARVYCTPRAAAGASAPGIPHALKGRKFLARLGRVAPRERGVMSVRLPEANPRSCGPGVRWVGKQDFSRRVRSN
jgi:hypothetical protein